MCYVNDRMIFACPSNMYQWAQGGDESNNDWPNEQKLPTSFTYNGSFFHEVVLPCWYGEQWVRPRYVAEISETSNLIMLVESRWNHPDLGNWFIGRRGPAEGDHGPL